MTHVQVKREPKSGEKRAQIIDFLCYFILIDVYMCVCLCAHTYVGAHRGQKKALGPLKLETQPVVGCLVWVLEVKLWSSVRTTGALNSRATLLVPNHLH